jgi:site-specific recombinase XerC
LDEYLKVTSLGAEPGSPLFPASIGKTGKLSRRPLVRTDAADMLKRRLKQAGFAAHYSPHSFRATGITNFLENDGTLEAAQRIAGHADSRTTKLYDRRGQKVLPYSTFGEDSILKIQALGHQDGTAFGLPDQ